jgi:hypothetical protein
LAQGGAAGTGGAGGAGGVHDAGPADAPAQCEYEGKLYNLGDTRSLGDCNYCVCQSQYGTAQFACTGMICGSGGALGTGGKLGTGGAIGTGGVIGAGGATGSGGSRDAAASDATGMCEYAGQRYQIGESFALSDGCTQCICTDRGIACSATICGTGGEVGPTGTGGTGGSCGDPVVKASYVSCMATKDEQSCASLGGTWNAFYPSGGFCMCPTGEGGCSCTKSTDCLGLCAAQSVDNSCTGVTEYQCSSLGGIGGCWCLAGQTEAICID